MSFNVEYNGTNINAYLIGYEREHVLCTGIGSATVEVSSSLLDSISVSTYGVITIYEDSIKKGEFYVYAIEPSANGITILYCQDETKKIVDHFITEHYEVDYLSYSKFWIEKFLTEAGVSYAFDVSGDGTTISNNTGFGLTTTYDTVIQLVQQNNWYFRVDENNVFRIGKIDLQLENHDIELPGENTILKVDTTQKDDILRNRVVVWGGSNIEAGGYIFADSKVYTPYNYDQKDLRTAVVSNPNVYTYSTAKSLANKMLKDTSVINYLKQVVLAGFVNAHVGQTAYLTTRLYEGWAIITNISVNCTDEGITTTITLDERCPRIYAFYGYRENYVYAGTEGAGVWRKLFEQDGWYNVSTGLTNLNVTDLAINKSIAGCITSDGYVNTRKLGTTYWRPVQPVGLGVTISGMTTINTIVSESILPSGVTAESISLSGLSYSYEETMALACDIDRLTNQVLSVHTVSGMLTVISGYWLPIDGIPSGIVLPINGIISTNGYITNVTLAGEACMSYSYGEGTAHPLYSGYNPYSGMYWHSWLSRSTPNGFVSAEEIFVNGSNDVFAYDVAANGTNGVYVACLVKTSENASFYSAKIPNFGETENTTYTIGDSVYNGNIKSSIAFMDEGHITHKIERFLEVLAGDVDWLENTGGKVVLYDITMYGQAVWVVKRVLDSNTYTEAELLAGDVFTYTTSVLTTLDIEMFKDSFYKDDNYGYILLHANGTGYTDYYSIKFNIRTLQYISTTFIYRLDMSVDYIVDKLHYKDNYYVAYQISTSLSGNTTISCGFKIIDFFNNTVTDFESFSSTNPDGELEIVYNSDITVGNDGRAHYYSIIIDNNSDTLGTYMRFFSSGQLSTQTQIHSPDPTYSELLSYMYDYPSSLKSTTYTFGGSHLYNGTTHQFIEFIIGEGWMDGLDVWGKQTHLLLLVKPEISYVTRTAEGHIIGMYDPVFITNPTEDTVTGNQDLELIHGVGISSHNSCPFIAWQDTSTSDGYIVIADSESGLEVERFLPPLPYEVGLYQYPVEFIGQVDAIDNALYIRQGTRVDGDYYTNIYGINAENGEIIRWFEDVGANSTSPSLIGNIILGKMFIPFDKYGYNDRSLIINGVAKRVGESEYTLLAITPQITKLELSQEMPLIAFGGNQETDFGFVTVLPLGTDSQELDFNSMTNTDLYVTMSGSSVIDANGNVIDGTALSGYVLNSGYVLDARTYDVFDGINNYKYLGAIRHSGVLGKINLVNLQDITDRDLVNSSFLESNYLEVASGITLTHFETTNYQDIPYIFASNDTAPARFFERAKMDLDDGYEDFVEYSTNLPNARITCIRADDRI